jgi:hypothetical protein
MVVVMPAKLTKDEFYKKFKTKCPDIEIDLDTFVNTNTKATFICPVYGKWEAKPNNVMNGRRHPAGKQERSKATFRDKYGCDNPLKSQLVREKIKKTNLERYGNEVALRNKDIYNKTKKTLKDRYGVDAPIQHAAIRKKTEETNLKKHGTVNAMATKASRAKARETMLNKYGHAHPIQVPSIQEAIKNTCLSKYGKENPAQSKSVQAKMTATTHERYGVNNILKHPDVKAKAANELLHKYGEGGPLSDPNVQGKIKDTLHSKYGVTNCAFIPGVVEQALNTRDEKGYKQFESAAEVELRDWVRSLDLTTNKKAVKAKQIDIFIKSLNIAIEYNGLYWHSTSRNRDENYHISKTTACAKAGIQLIHIWEHWWSLRKEQVKTHLLNTLDKNQHTVTIVECKFKQVPNNESIAFFEKYHVNGHDPEATLTFGITWNEELVTAISLAPRHQKIGTMVLTRLANKTNVKVIDGLKTLSEYVTSALNCTLVTHVDRCLSNGIEYINAGWKIETTTPPECFYISKNGRYFPQNEMTNQKSPKLINKIWDCGKLILTFPN